MANPAGAADKSPAAEPATLDEAVEWLREHFRPEAAVGMRVTYSLDLSGPGGGIVQLAISDGRVAVDRVDDPAADVRLRLSAADYFRVLAGGANADLLYMEDRLEIDGDLALATKLRTLFRPRA